MRKLFFFLSLVCLPATGMERAHVRPQLLVSLDGVIKRIFQSHDAVSLAVVDQGAFSGMSIQVKRGEQPCLGPSMPLIYSKKLYVAYYMADVVAVLDPRDNFSVVATIDLSRPESRYGAGLLEPVAIGERIWVAHQLDNRVSVIDPSTHQRIATIEVGRWPLMPVLKNEWVEVTNKQDMTVTFIDPVNLHVVETCKIGAQ